MRSYGNLIPSTPPPLIRLILFLYVVQVVYARNCKGNAVACNPSMTHGIFFSHFTPQSTPVGSLQTGHEVVVSPNRDRHQSTNRVSKFVFLPRIKSTLLDRYIHTYKTSTYLYLAYLLSPQGVLEKDLLLSSFLFTFLLLLLSYSLLLLL